MATTLTQKKYQESEKVKEAFQNYNDYKNNNKPQDFVFSDAELLTQTQNEFFNKEDFSYDLESDPLYNQYKKNYIEQGKQAMEDTIGNASALSGGYGNSYAQTAGNKAYNSYLDKLNNIVPELYEMAYSRYSDELKTLENKLGYLTDKNKDEYSRYLDSYNIYTDEVNALRNLYLNEYENDIAIQDSEWESAYKIAMKEQEKAIADAEIGYKYYAANLEKQQADAKLAAQQAQFEAELAYKKELDEKEDKYREQELRLNQLELFTENQQFWAEFNEETKDYISQNELYIMQANGQLYDVMSALDYNYEDDSTVRYKALIMGIDEDFIDSYFEAKYKGR
ncbi:MAG: hypothetical protein IKU48_01295 [Clostridia bacterium]|nr:hypothetical protein [Clostridia bacterium]